MKNNFYRHILLYIFKWLIVSFILGFLGANIVFVLHLVINYLRNMLQYSSLLTPIIGGLLVGLIIYYFDFRSAGLGTNRYIDFAKQNRKIAHPGKLLVSKFANTSLTLGLMGVQGLVGPILLIGSSLAMFVQQLAIKCKINLINKFEYRVLNVCGAAAALGPLLGAPIGSGIFATEVLYKSSLDYNDLFPAILSGSFGCFFYNLFYHHHRLNLSYEIDLPNLTTQEILLTIGVALFAGFMGQGIILIYNFFRDFFEKLQISSLLKPVVAGLVVGLLIKLFNIDGVVTKLKIEEILFSGVAVKILFYLLLFKILITIVVVSSGGSVAMVDTALLTGGLLGNLLHYLVPLPLNLLVVIGMSAILSSVANVPLATIILISEIYGINLSLSVVLGSIIGFLVGRAQTVYQYLELE
ncbi:MAG: chloride channel protein [Bacillota bacterium]